MMDKFMVIASKLSANRYLGAIRDAFILVLPLTLSASFAILINNVVLAGNLPYGLTNPTYYSEGFIEVTTKLKFIFDSIEFGGLQFITLMIMISLPYTLSKMSKVDSPITNALIVLGTFLAILPKGSLVTAGYFQHQWAAGYTEAIKTLQPTTTLASLFSGTNLFTALIMGILMTELLIWLQGFDKLRITLPDSVPPMVARAFSSVIPALLVFLFAGVIAFGFKEIHPWGLTHLSEFISKMLQEPFLALAKTNLGGTIIVVTYVFFANFLWIFGLHGPNILGGFSQATLGVLNTNNVTLFSQTGDAYSPDLAVFTAGFVDGFTQYGGSGASLGLIIAVFLVSKRADYKAIANLALMPGIFEINEPVVFGMPIVLNPILGIPFVLAPLASIILPGVLMTIGWLPKVVVSVPWVTPPIINSFLATGASWKGAVVGVANLIIVVAVYIPFVLIANKQAEVENADNNAE